MVSAIFAVAFLASAGILAIWIDTRFPRLAPHDFIPAFLHLGAAALANQLLDGPVGGFVARSTLPASRAVAVIGVVLPLVVYAALAGLWTLKLAQRALTGHLR
ncbi:MAG TPA: hypothetical protein VE777_11950 [Gaiellales bacterium]|jgi:hypothetical protein|nr:hypothetical protein [Gaiellales bacterium]